MSVSRRGTNLFISKVLYGTLAVVFMVFYARRRSSR
jgi:hypothetical protein